MSDSRCLLDVAERQDGYLKDIHITTKWVIRDVVDCAIIHYPDYIYVYILNSYVRGYGARLLREVLEYLRIHNYGISIKLYDNGTLNKCKYTMPLWIITLLTRGELSFYNRFGFAPNCEGYNQYMNVANKSHSGVNI